MRTAIDFAFWAALAVCVWLLLYLPTPTVRPRRRSKGGKVLLVLAVLGAVAHAQDAPKLRAVQVMTRMDWALLAADSGVRAMDVYSTHHALTNGGHEDVLPDGIAHHPPVMALYSASVVATEFTTMRSLERHHPRLAHIAMIAEIAVTSYAVAQNMGIAKPVPIPGWKAVGR